MRGVIPNYLHSYNLFFFLFVFSIMYLRTAFAIDAHILPSSESLTHNRTLVSLGDDFELGFFEISGDQWYIGIWYKKIPEITYVWVANRDNPLSSSAGTLKISGINLVLLNQSDIPVWSTNLTGAVRYPVVAELLPSGNFVLKDSETSGQRLLWQSFDYPTDTLLPHMKLGLNRRTEHDKFITSWKNALDLSSGDYTLKLELQGLPECILRGEEGLLSFRCGPWDGKRFNGMPEMQQWHLFNISYDFTDNKEEAAFTLKVTTPNIYVRLTITYQGLLQLSTWEPKPRKWNFVWMSAIDDCVPYGSCSPYAYCDINRQPMCNCLKGFERGKVLYCERKTPLSCKGDGFFKMSNMKMPDTKWAIVDRGIGLEKCKDRCMKDCNCTGYAYMDIQVGGTGCVMWNKWLHDIRSYVDTGQDLYVKLAPADLVEPNKNGGKRRKTIGITLGATLLLLLSFIIFLWRKKHTQARALATEYGRRRQNLLRTSGRHLLGEDTEDIELPLMEYDVISTATNDFSECNKLGQGGFGTVYKGMLPDGEEIAVKRLSKVSTQGTDEFKTELMLIAKLQHNNLVRLLGCYADEEEKILVYEYLENLSLDYYIFVKSYELNWQKRFDIIKGIARGLLYLHQDSRCKVIHRDLKASNILLDQDMIPKISDFGMARIFGRDDDEATTRRIVGTYGYMAPEYAIHGQYSEKSDVFSFGVLILEIISGKRNKGFTPDSDLLSYVWSNVEEGTGLDVVDPNIKNLSTFQPDEILRCITIGLECVQENAEARPTMPRVFMKLGSETEVFLKPRPPGHTVVRCPCDIESTSSSMAIECPMPEPIPR
ncbi:unnamed protein product [Cochlearia groenlandica]